jgi:hypothetical protein
MGRLTESFLHLKGYVQGMSDLCAPIYVVMSGDENMTFWCFVEVMNRMVSACGFYKSASMKFFFFCSETKFSAGSKRHEETTVNLATTD